MSVYQRAHTHGVVDHSQTPTGDDEWETDPDYANDISEKDQRKGSKLIVPQKDQVLEKAPNGDLLALAKSVQQQDAQAAKAEYEEKRAWYGEKRLDEHKSGY